MLKIVQAPNPVLAEEAKKIEKINSDTHKLIKEMVKTLEAAKDPEGVGLAAPQIGKSLQLFIIKETPDSDILTFINPVIENQSPIRKEVTEKGKKKKPVKLEGCLSLQDIWGVVHRSDEITLSYLDETGNKHTKTFTGFLAVIVQHEYDHIHGTLFPKRVLEQNGKLYKAKQDEKGEMYFEEMEI